MSCYLLLLLFFGEVTYAFSHFYIQVALVLCLYIARIFCVHLLWVLLLRSVGFLISYVIIAFAFPLPCFLYKIKSTSVIKLIA